MFHRYWLFSDRWNHIAFERWCGTNSLSKVIQSRDVPRNFLWKEICKPKDEMECNVKWNLNSMTSKSVKTNPSSGDAHFVWSLIYTDRERGTERSCSPVFPMSLGHFSVPESLETLSNPLVACLSIHPRKLTFWTQTLVVWVDVSPFPRGASSGSSR